MLDARILAALLASTLAACSVSVGRPDPEPCPEHEPPEAPRTEWELYPSSASLGAEQAMLRAAAGWTEATGGAVSFRFHNSTERFECRDGNVRFMSLTPEEALEAGMEAESGKHTAPSNAQGGCHVILLLDPWPPERREAGMSLHERLGASPLVAVAAHELGHAMGAPHASPEERAVMAPSISVARTAWPTCHDASLLGLAWGRPLPCSERSRAD